MAVAAEPVEGPALIRASITCLLTARRSTFSQKWKRLSEPPHLLAGGDDLLDRLLAHALDRGQAEADHALACPAPVSLIQRREVDSLSLMSGASTSMPISLALADVLDDLVRVAHFVGQQGRHELDGQWAFRYAVW